jgi:hypothetical protein
MTNHIAISAFDLAAPLLVAALTWTATRLSTLISTRIRNERVRAALLRLDDVVMAVVKETLQVTVKAIRATSANGKLPPGTADVIKRAAIAAVKAHLGPLALAELASALGLSPDGLEHLLSTKVEAAVYTAKQQSATNGVHDPSEPVPAGK